MANYTTDPLEEIIADGRLHTCPVSHYGLPEVLTVNLELMATTLVTRLDAIYQNDTNLLNNYVGSGNSVTQAIHNDVVSMVNFLVGHVYNKLRSILERKHPTMRSLRMNPKCPVPMNQEFPAWLSSALSCIGPCRVIDGPVDTLIVYASTTATQNNFGRDQPPGFNEGHYFRFMTALRHCNIVMAPFDHHGITGSYFPTISPMIGQYTWVAYGQVHPSYYENEDIARLALVTSDMGVTPFEEVGMTFDYVNDEATLNALAAVPAPPNIPAGQTAGSLGRPVGAHFRVNYYGIQPATTAVGAIPAEPRGMYVLGRGMSRYYQCILAHGIAATEVNEILRFRLMRRN